MICMNKVNLFGELFKMTFRLNKQRVFVVCIVSICIITKFISFSDNNSTVIQDDIRSDISCYTVLDRFFGQNVHKELEATMNTIYFLETSCKGGLDSRQACSVESAAKANPNWNIRVVFTGPIDSNYQENKTMSVLSSIKNIELVRINIKEFAKGTLLDQLFTKNVLKNSSYPVVHASDMLRTLVLNKYGGVYLDLDMIVMKSFDDLPKNFVVREFGVNVAVGILAFTNDGAGKVISDLMLSYLSTEFSSHVWGANGAGIISKIFNDICNTTFMNVSSDTCAGIHVFDNRSFIPIPYVSLRKYYGDYEIEPSEAYTHHLWNALGGKTKIQRNSLYSRLAQKYCPSIYEKYGDDFGN